MTLAGEVREKVRSAPVGSFLRSSEVRGSRPAVDTALHRLCAEGELVRVRRGLYWRGVRSRYGAGRPSAVDVGIAAAGSGAGPSGWAAAHALGLSTQVPAVPEVAVVGRPPSGVEGVRFRSRSNLARLGLDARGIALLEVLRSWPLYVEGEWVDLVGAVGGLWRAGEIDIAAVASVTWDEPSPHARELMARLLHDLEG